MQFFLDREPEHDHTASGSDWLYAPSWINTWAQHAFDNEKDQSGFSESRNMTGADLVYGPSLGNVLTGRDDYGAGLPKYMTLIRDEHDIEKKLFLK